jgi:hypothetical protein
MMNVALSHHFTEGLKKARSKNAREEKRTNGEYCNVVCALSHHFTEGSKQERREEKANE